MKRGSIVLACAAALGCSTAPLDSQPSPPVPSTALQKNWESGSDMLPIPAAPPDGSLLFVQAVRSGTERALVTGLPNSVQAGVTEVRALNRRTGLTTSFQTHETISGVAFTGVLERTRAGDTVAFWGTGPSFAPGGPGINSVDEKVQIWSVPYPASVRAMAMIRTPDGREDGLYIGDEGNGLFALLPDGSFRRYTVEDGLPGNFVTALLSDGANGIWLGVSSDAVNDGHLSHLTFAGGLPYVESYSWSDGLAGPAIKAMISDGAGGLWLGFDGGGLCRATDLLRRPRFACYNPELGNANSLPSQLVRALELDEQGGLWIAAWGGFSHLTFAGDGSPRFRNYTAAEGLSTDRITALSKDGRGGFWLGTAGEGAFHLTFPDGRALFTRYTAADGLPSGAINALAADGSGGTWIGGGCGFGRFVPANQPPFAYGVTASEGLRSNDITAILSDGAGGFYLGTRSDGFARVTFEGGRPAVENFWAESGIQSNFVRDVASDGGRGAWVASDRGLSHLRIENGHSVFENYTTADGLPGNQVHAVIGDGGGGAWFSVPGRGIGRLTFDGSGRPRFANYTSPSGRVDRVVALAADESGGLWVAGWMQSLLHLTFPAGAAKFATYTSADGLPEGTDWWIRAVASDGSGGVWGVVDYFGLPGSPLRPPLFHMTLRDARPFFRFFSTEDGLSDHPYRRGEGNRLADVISDRAGGVWVVSDFGMTHVGSAAADYPIQLYAVGGNSLALASGAGVWVGDFFLGLRHVTFSDGETRVPAYGIRDGLPSRTVRSIASHPDGGVWLGTEGSGLALFTE